VKYTHLYQQDHLNNHSIPKTIDSTTISTMNIVLCELFNPLVHGMTEESSTPEIHTHYLVTEKLTPSEVMMMMDKTESAAATTDISPFSYAASRRKNYIRVLRHMKEARHHEYIRNYAKIATHTSTYLPQLAVCLRLPGDECVAILKTHWLRLIQRSWKKVFRSRLNVTKRRCRSQNSRHREIHGTWPDDCTMPTLKGMMSGLSRR